MIYPIVVYGHPVLKKVAVDIDRDYPDLQQFVNDMFDTMYHAEGLGLAAPQVGKSIRLFVIDGAPVADDEPDLADFKKVFINAHIVEKTGDLIPMNEGCLSIPNIREEVKRESHIRIRYVDENWTEYDEVYDGYKARVIQHEYDHLDGKLFVEKVNPLKRQLLKGKLADISKGKFEADYKTLVYTPRKR
jgi:peptide deformylase